ncbi:MAG: threonylcarbamoyl-AMP synthase [Proteobacteria bacterium]|nr:threonylcarbamoyl-AMP synthase [Pseudomonadota bacterium]
MFDKAVEFLLNEDVVVIPTETVYGLAALATSDKSVLKIYNLKKRPSFNPLIVHVCDYDMINEFANFKSFAKDVCSFFWDLKKSLTVVLPLKDKHPLSNFVTSGLKTVAVRLPHHPLTLQLIQKTGPLAAPSANISNSVSPTTPDHVRQSFKENCPLILDGGPSTVGVESTILDLTHTIPTLLRPGSVTLLDFKNYFGFDVNIHESHSIVAPGMMKHHYSPGCKVYLNAEDKTDGGLFVGFGTDTLHIDDFNLSPSKNLEEAAKNLFIILNEVLKMNPSNVSFAPIPTEGIGLAINDRLTKAAGLS